MERPSREITNIRIAQIISERGTCSRLKVGAVITEDNKIISTGYNGPAKDQPHCSSELCNQKEGCQRAVHAEANAIINAELSGSLFESFTGGGERVLYCTTQPCLGCSSKIVGAGISKVYYVEPYRNTDGLEFLLNNDVEVFKIDKDGNTEQIQDLQN